MAEFKLPKNSQIQKGKHFPAAGAKKPRTFKVYRWNPDDGMNPRVDTYDVDLAACGPMVRSSYWADQQAQGAGVT